MNAFELFLHTASSKICHLTFIVDGIDDMYRIVGGRKKALLPRQVDAAALLRTRREATANMVQIYYVRCATTPHESKEKS